MSFSFIQRAEQGNRSALSFISTIFITIGGFMLGQMPLTLAVLYKSHLTGANFAETSGSVDKMSALLGYPLFFILVMLQFIAVIFFLWICVKYIHRRKFSTLFSDEDRFRKKEFIAGIFITLVMLIAGDLIYYLNNPATFTWVFNPRQFFIFLPLALLLVPMQTFAEELFFRGYLYQAFGLVSRNKWISVIVCSILFGSVHFMNPEVMAFGFWEMAVVYIGTGFMIGLSVILSKGIEFGFGFHFINNLYLSLIKTFPGSALQGPTLWIIPKPETQYILAEFGLQFTLFTTILLIRYRKNLRNLISPVR